MFCRFLSSNPFTPAVTAHRSPSSCGQVFTAGAQSCFTGAESSHNCFCTLWEKKQKPAAGAGEELTTLIQSADFILIIKCI